MRLHKILMYMHRALGVKGLYPDTLLPYHNRNDSTVIDIMHTIKDVVANIMDVVRGEKSFDAKSLQLTMESLAIADRRYSKLHFPERLNPKKLPMMISKPTGLKSHDWKQALSHKMKVLNWKFNYEQYSSLSVIVNNSHHALRVSVHLLICIQWLMTIWHEKKSKLFRQACFAAAKWNCGLLEPFYYHIIWSLLKFSINWISV